MEASSAFGTPRGNARVDRLGHRPLLRRRRTSIELELDL